MRLQKEQQKENNRKFNLNLRENAVEAVKTYFAPQNMFNRAFLERQYCGMWAIFNENSSQKSEKMVKLVIILYFLKTIIFSHESHKL